MGRRGVDRIAGRISGLTSRVSAPSPSSPCCSSTSACRNHRRLRRRRRLLRHLRFPDHGPAPAGAGRQWQDRTWRFYARRMRRLLPAAWSSSRHAGDVGGRPLAAATPGVAHDGAASALTSGTPLRPRVVGLSRGDRPVALPPLLVAGRGGAVLPGLAGARALPSAVLRATRDRGPDRRVTVAARLRSG